MVGEVWGDAGAALGIIHRHGLGKSRHIDISLLWVHEIAANKWLKYMKALGEDNPADVFATYLDTITGDHHVNSLGFKYTHGRASEAPKLYTISLCLGDCIIGTSAEDWQHPTLLRKTSRHTERLCHTMIATLESETWHGGTDDDVSEAVVVVEVHAVMCRGPNVVTSTPRFRPRGARPTGHGYGLRAPTRPPGFDCRTMIQQLCGRRHPIATSNALLPQQTTFAWIGCTRPLCGWRSLGAGASPATSRRTASYEDNHFDNPYNAKSASLLMMLSGDEQSLFEVASSFA